MRGGTVSLALASSSIMRRAVAETEGNIWRWVLTWSAASLRTGRVLQPERSACHSESQTAKGLPAKLRELAANGPRQGKAGGRELPCGLKRASGSD